MGALKCTLSLPVLYLRGAKILHFQMLMEKLILGPALQPSCLVCRILWRLQDRHDSKAAVVAYVLFGFVTKAPL